MANVKTDIIGYINDSMEMSKDEIFSIVETILFPFPFLKIEVSDRAFTVSNWMFKDIPPPKTTDIINLR